VGSTYVLKSDMDCCSPWMRYIDLAVFVIVKNVFAALVWVMKVEREFHHVHTYIVRSSPIVAILGSATASMLISQCKRKSLRVR